MVLEVDRIDATGIEFVVGIPESFFFFFSPRTSLLQQQKKLNKEIRHTMHRLDLPHYMAELMMMMLWTVTV
jgi:hypothetical protein